MRKILSEKIAPIIGAIIVIAWVGIIIYNGNSEPNKPDLNQEKIDSANYENSIHKLSLKYHALYINRCNFKYTSDFDTAQNKMFFAQDYNIKDIEKSNSMYKVKIEVWRHYFMLLKADSSQVVKLKASTFDSRPIIVFKIDSAFRIDTTPSYKRLFSIKGKLIKV